MAGTDWRAQTDVYVCTCPGLDHGHRRIRTRRKQDMGWTVRHAAWLGPPRMCSTQCVREPRTYHAPPLPSRGGWGSVGPKFEVPRALTESPGRGPPTASYLPAAALGAGHEKRKQKKKKGAWVGAEPHVGVRRVVS